MTVLSLEEGDEVALGTKYKDTVFGITGVAMAQCRYFTGCDHVQLQWEKDGEIKSDWFDIVRLAPVKARAKRTATTRSRGGPADRPPTRGPGETMRD